MNNSSGYRLGEAVIGTKVPRSYEQILSREALGFIEQLHRKFDSRRKSLMDRRHQVQKRIDAGTMPDFLESTVEIRRDKWSVAPAPLDLQDRRVEITGPVERKMMINALNSGAKVFMADFEDANSPTFRNNIEGQINLRDAVAHNLSVASPDGKYYELCDTPATLVVRPRGWHLIEKHLLIAGQPVAASLFDFGLYFFHNASRLIENGSGPYFYLPKLENHLEGRLWNDVFDFAEDTLELPRGSTKATVLIETILAAFEMEEILFELKQHIVGLNAGRWDYIFSIIKKFKAHQFALLPDRGQVTMAVPFMRAYTDLLVQTCHKRGAHAIGGMAAFIPNRKEPEINERAFRKVREDKEREARAGFDGTWVAHPDMVSTAEEIFDAVLGTKPHQKDNKREDVHVEARDLTNFAIPDGKITEAGVRGNINVALLYLLSWLQGRGATAINNLMEDTATAEIARAQLWQWLHFEDVKLDNHEPIDGNLWETLFEEEFRSIDATLRHEREKEYLNLARRILTNSVKTANFSEFLTWPAYEHLT